MTPQLLFDTDIGTDVDDALALALLIAERDGDLVGVTTVHAHAPLRAAIARALLEASDKRHVPSWRAAPSRSGAAASRASTGTRCGATREPAC